jgi:hypothetical protein
MTQKHPNGPIDFVAPRGHECFDEGAFPITSTDPDV